jgi:hypothetical protein
MIDIRNPELLRYVRSELRPARIAVIMGGTLGIALLLALLISANTGPSDLYTQRYWQDVYGAVLVATSIILVLWSLLNASQAVVSERSHRTFDFWRTTRLSSSTLAIGKLFGAPIGAWLQFATALPIAVVTGALGGVRVTVVIGAFLIIGLCNVALSALALSLSMRSQDSRRATMMMLLLGLGLMPGLSSLRTYGGSGDGITFSAWSALNPVFALGAWHQGEIVRVLLFGHPVPSLLVTAALCLVVIAWSLTALVRSIKLEPDQSSLFSPEQVVGISICVLLFNYAAFQPWGRQMVNPQATLNMLIGTGLLATILCLYFTVVSTLRTRDRLRHDLRVDQPQQIAFRTVAPWLITGLIGLFSALLALAKYRGLYAEEAVHWAAIIGTYLSLAVYAVRDGMFLQWMIAQRVKAPVLKGSVALGIYYAGSAILSILVAGPHNMWQMMRWLSPFRGDPAQPANEPVWLLIVLLIPPVATTVLLAFGVFRKMQRVSQQAADLIHA